MKYKHKMSIFNSCLPDTITDLIATSHVQTSLYKVIYINIQYDLMGLEE